MEFDGGLEDTEGSMDALPDPREESQRSKVKIGPFTPVPNKFFGSGMARSVGPSASLLYFALCENANRNKERSLTFKASDNALASETGLSPRTIRDVRIKLLENNLVEYTRKPGESYTYTLIPQELKWLKRDARPRRKRKPRAIAATRVKQGQ